jgi:hypothetical protein
MIYHISINIYSLGFVGKLGGRLILSGFAAGFGFVSGGASLSFSFCNQNVRKKIGIL